MGPSILGAMCGLVMLVAGPAQAAGARSFALIIGYNGPAGGETPPLRYADDDAVGYAALFEELGAEVRLLVELDEATRRLHPGLTPNGPPTKEGIRVALDALNERIKSSEGPSALFLIFAGHGDVRHGEGTITLADGALTRHDFAASVLARSAARTNHVIIDACKSYFLVFERGDGADDRIPYEGSFDDHELGSNAVHTGFLLSTSSARSSHEWEAFQAGIFSYELRSGLRGAADADRDGRITYRELAAFIHTANGAIPNEKYRPSFIALPPEGDETLIEVPRDSARLLVVGGKDEHYAVETAHGVRVADIHPGAEEARLWLPKSVELFVRAMRAGLEYHLPAGSGLLALAGLDGRPATALTRGAADVSFQQIFALPFDRGAYLAFGGEELAVRGARSERARRAAPAWLLPAGGAVSVALAAVGGGLRLRGDALFSLYKDAPAGDQPALRTSTEGFDRAATGLFIAAGVTALATLLVYELTSD